MGNASTVHLPEADAPGTCTGDALARKPRRAALRARSRAGKEAEWRRRERRTAWTVRRVGRHPGHPLLDCRTIAVGAVEATGRPTHTRRTRERAASLPARAS